jgi:hypothetical protein
MIQRAGSQQAASVVAMRIAATAANVVASCGWMPKRKLARNVDVN